MTLYIRRNGAAIAPGKAASSHAVSGEADTLQHDRDDAVATIHTLRTQRQADLTLALLEACAQANQEDWDAYGGRGVLLGSYVITERLLRTLPERLPLPEISVHPDGELALDWIAGSRQVFTVSVGQDGTLSYAGLFGAAKVTGKELFSGIFPPSLLQHIGRVSEANAGGR